MADDAPPPVDPPITEVTEPEAPAADPAADAAPAPEVEQLVQIDTYKDEKEPDVGYHLVLWQADDDGGDPLWPQHVLADEVQPVPDLYGLDDQALECGWYQADLYKDDATTAALIAGGVLTGPNNPTESWPGSEGYQPQYANQFEVTDCEPEYVPPTECESYVTLPTATAENPRGWGDLLNGTWTADGIQLTATDTEEAYAYLDLLGTNDADQPYLLSTTLNGLATVGAGTSAIIIHTDKANVHVEADGQYWTKSGPGIFPETSPGFWSTYNLLELLQDATIDSVAVWVNPGYSLLLQSQAYNCMIQPFGAEAVIPPTTPPATGELAYTGGEGLLPLGVSALLMLLGTAGVLWRKRAALLQ